MKIYTSAQMKQIEANANEKGYAYIDMMHTAGVACAETTEKAYLTLNEKVAVVCGKGKNGGDGFVIARKLWEYGFRKIFVLLVYGKPNDDLCTQMYDAMIRYPVVTADAETEKDTCIHHIKTADDCTS